MTKLRFAWFLVLTIGVVASGCSKQVPSSLVQATNASATQSSDENWIAVSQLDGRFRAKMPGTPKIEDQTADSELGSITFHSEKVLTPGIVYNVLITTYPEAVISRYDDPLDLLERLAAGHENQKAGAERDHLQQLEGSKKPTIEHRFNYKLGKSPQGEELSWYAIHRHVLVDNSVCTLFVDVQDAARQRDPAKVDADISRFFDSIQVIE